MKTLFNLSLQCNVKTGDIVVNRNGKAYIIESSDYSNGLVHAFTRDERKVFGSFHPSTFNLAWIDQ